MFKNLFKKLYIKIKLIFKHKKYNILFYLYDFIINLFNKKQKEYVETSYNKFKIKNYKKPLTLHFFTYGDRNYLKSKKRLLAQVEKMKIFNNIHSFGPENIDGIFFKDYKDLLSQKRGGGYYIWKFYFIRKLLNDTNEGDFIIYCDAGCTVNYFAKKRFIEYINIIENSSYHNISFQLKHKEKFWTTKEIFKAFDIKVESEIGNSDQLISGVLIFKNTSHSKMIINKAFEIIEGNYKLLTDEYNNKKQIIGFEENRHDQSILSIVRKIYGTNYLKDETYFLKFGSVESMMYPFWATRISD